MRCLFFGEYWCDIWPVRSQYNKVDNKCSIVDGRTVMDVIVVST